MKTLGVSKEQLTAPCVWEATGRSPANSPMAVIQTAQSLAQFAAAPEAGIDLYELVNAMVMNGPLANSKVQKTREQMQDELNQQLAGMGGPVPGSGGEMGGMPPSDGVSFGPVGEDETALADMLGAELQ